MYPVLRFALATARARSASMLALEETHVSGVICLPFDIDPWRELNNGRTLTLYDLGRIPLMVRTGVSATLRRQGWGMAVAGASVRYRRRVRLFDRLGMRSSLLGRDRRFVYIHQSMWRGAETVSAALFRSAITGAERGIVPTDEAFAAHGRPDWDPPIPGWVAAWIAAEDSRPWPPAHP
jgi:acyl-CoA thioesterase FadM